MRYDEERYGGGDDYVRTRRQLTPQQVIQVQTDLIAVFTDENTYPQLAADQNNFALSEGFVLHRFTTDASRTITGLNGVGVGIKVIVNVGAQDLVLANDNASSDAQNRILCHTGANITLNPNESVLIIYDRASSRVRTIGFA